MQPLKNSAYDNFKTKLIIDTSMIFYYNHSTF